MHTLARIPGNVFHPKHGCYVPQGTYTTEIKQLPCGTKRHRRTLTNKTMYLYEWVLFYNDRKSPFKELLFPDKLSVLVT